MLKKNVLKYLIIHNSAFIFKLMCLIYESDIILGYDFVVSRLKGVISILYFQSQNILKPLFCYIHSFNFDAYFRIYFFISDFRNCVICSF